MLGGTLLFLLLWVTVTTAQQRVIRAPTFIIDLDLPPNQRWLAISTHFKDEAAAVAKYFYAQLPAVVADMIEIIAGDLVGLFGDYGTEMQSIADAMGLDTGLVVTLNYVYELRDMSKHGHPNNTGGYTPPKNSQDFYRGMCTSIVAENSETNAIWHVRNLDWNLPDAMRTLTYQCNFTKGGQLLFTGGCYGGYIGLLTGMKPRSSTTSGFSITLDARNLGGNPAVDLLAAIIEGAMDPTHLARRVLENAQSYDEAKSMLESGQVAAPIYFIVSGGEKGQGAVLTRDRNALRDAWPLQSPSRWYVIETNYDHWLEPPAEDDRRAWGISYMNAVGPKNVGYAPLFDVMSKWPINNNFTAYTSMASVSENVFSLWTRFGHNPPPPPPKGPLIASQ